MTASPGIAPPPCSHGWPTVLVFFLLGMPWEAIFKGIPPFLLTIGRGQDCPQRCLLATWTPFVHPRAFLPPRHEPWTLCEVGRGLLSSLLLRVLFLFFFGDLLSI